MQVQFDSRPIADWSDAARPILICVLGSFQVVTSDRSVSLRGGGKSEALLGSLALRGEGGIARDRLIDLLWPDGESSLAGQSLNSLVYSLHRLLGPDLGGAPPVLQSGGWYRLNLKAGVAVDLARFDALTVRAEMLSQAGEMAAAAAAYDEAVELYRGDLSAGADVHALVERERVRARYLTVLSRLADYYFAADEYAACLDYLVRLLAVDGCREDAHRLAMRCYVRTGQRAQALRQYRLCEAILAAEFDAAPESATRALFARIRLDPEGI